MARGNASWRIGIRELAWIVMGALLYGGTSWLTNISPLSGALGGEIRPGVAIPIFLGFTGGPIVGFFSGFLGNLFADFTAGYLSYPPSPATGLWFKDLAAGFDLTWQFGNGLMGLIPGLYALYLRRYVSLSDQIKALLVTILAIVVGIGFASYFDPYVFGTSLTGDSGTIATEFIPIARINVINAVILIPILLFNYERLDLAARGWIRSGLMQRLLLTILISAALPVALLGLFLTQQSTGGQTGSPQELTIKLTFTILLTLVFTVANAVLVAQSISRPLLRLTGAAQQMEEGQLSVEQAGELKATPGSDEVTRLSQIFGQMAQEVIQREQTLRQQVRELQIMVDQSKRDQQVAEIVDSDFFQDLQTRAKQMRDRGGSSGKGKSSPKTSKK
jgi:energy-coupling factor transport system substrate-specific component